MYSNGRETQDILYTYCSTVKSSLYKMNKYTPTPVSHFFSLNQLIHTGSNTDN
jgi:hypothetical protein